MWRGLCFPARARAPTPTNYASPHNRSATRTASNADFWHFSWSHYLHVAVWPIIVNIYACLHLNTIYSQQMSGFAENSAFYWLFAGARQRQLCTMACNGKAKSIKFNRISHKRFTVPPSLSLPVASPSHEKTLSSTVTSPLPCRQFSK